MAFRAALSRQLATLTEQLTTALAEEVDPLRAQVADLTAARERDKARAAELAAANDALSLELETGAAEREAATGALAALEFERRRAEHLALRAQQLDARVTELQQQHAQLGDVVDTLRRAAEAQQAERLAAEADTSQLRSALEDARNAADGEVALLREELAAARSAHRERLVARLARLFEEMGRGTTVDDVLSAAANGLADDFARVAVFAAAGGHLEARYQRGFDQDSGVERTSPVLGDGSFLARTAAEDELGLHTADSLGTLPFAGSPSVIITAPVVVRGELIALVYADNHGQPRNIESSATPARIADIVRRHAALRLDRLTVELRLVGELRAYARMLLDEVEYVYRADVSARTPDGERLERLTENLRCARQIYQQRAEVDGPAVAALLEEVVTAAVATKAATPFGRELAGIAPLAHPAMAPAPSTV